MTWLYKGKTIYYNIQVFCPIFSSFIIQHVCMYYVYTRRLFSLRDLVCLQLFHSSMLNSCLFRKYSFMLMFSHGKKHVLCLHIFISVDHMTCKVFNGRILTCLSANILGSGCSRK